MKKNLTHSAGRRVALLLAALLAVPIGTRADDGDTFEMTTSEGVTLTLRVKSEEESTAYIYSASFANVSETLESFTIPSTATRILETDASDGSDDAEAGSDGGDELSPFRLYTVTGVGGYAMRRTKAKTLVIPETVTTIGQYAFCESSSLKKVVCYSRESMADVVWAPSTAFSGDMEKFVTTAGSTYMSIYENATAVVPFGMKYAYSHGNCWKYFKEIVEGTEEETLANAPSFSVAGGEYDGAQSVALYNANRAGDIYYYLTGEDNSSPYWSFAPEVKKYDGTPIELGSSGVIVAYVSDGTHRSAVASESYTINAAGITVAGMEVNAKNQDDVLGDKGSVRLDAKTGALVLENADIDASMYKAESGIVAAGDDLTITLIGENTITAEQTGIEYGYANGTGTGGNLTIVGEGDGASLTINMNGKGGNGILAYLSNVTVENCTLTINGGIEGIYFKAGGKGDGVLTVNGATVDITAEQSAITGVFELNMSKDLAITAPVGAEFVGMGEDSQGNGNIQTPEGTSPTVTIGTAAIDVEKQVPDMYFRTDMVEETLTEMPARLATPLERQLVYSGDGTVSYESSDENIATIEQEDGMSYIYVHATGTVTITATATETEAYEAASCTLTLTTTLDMEPVEEETTIDFTTPDAFTEDDGTTPADMNNIVVGNVYITVDNTTDDGTDVAGYYDTTENCIVINKTTTSEQMGTVVENEPGSNEVTSNYTGLIIEVPAGQGNVIVNTQTEGDSYVAVKVGDDTPTTEQKTTQGDVEVAYDVTENTYVYIYASSSGNEAKPLTGARKAPATGANAVKIYSITVQPTGFALNVSDAAYATYYNSKAVRLPSGVKAATIDAVDDNGTLTVNYRYDGDNATANIVPGGTAVLIAAAEASYVLTLVSDDTQAAPEGNLLHGSDTEALTTGGDSYYKLTYSADNTHFGFYWGEENGGAFSSPAHKAWLALSASLAKGATGFALDESTLTGITKAQTTGTATRSACYTLDGRRLSGQPTRKGIYIVDGRKQVVQ